ncbi:hypothetical protein ACLVWU_17690 [Bdellovibrio sp. HCB290]|uniref:hypothetical protein n=1 Tax=Bdellovibrio sp. HCB290 TaxID=3394356 RepID=UPI0039B3955F
MNEYQLLRKKHFDAAVAQTGFQTQESLTASFQIPKNLFSELQKTVMDYLYTSSHHAAVKKEVLSDFLEAFSSKAKNVSTSGIVIPKSYCDLAFTNVHRVIAEVMTQSNLREGAEFWIYPFNIRLKGAVKTSDVLSYPTELPHSETWVGCSKRSVLLHIPVLGDMENNLLKVWKPGAEMNADWLRPLASYHDANELIRNSQELSVSSQAGQVLMVDSSLLHGTYRHPNAGPRVSIDLNVVLKNYSNDIFPDEHNLLAERQKLSSQDFFEIGKSLRVHSPDGDGDIFSPVDGMRHPANIKIVKS